MNGVALRKSLEGENKTAVVTAILGETEVQVRYLVGVKPSNVG